MAFEEDPVLRRLATETAASGIPKPVETVLKVAVAAGLIHEITGWRPPGPFGR